NVGWIVTRAGEGMVVAIGAPPGTARTREAAAVGPSDERCPERTSALAPSDVTIRAEALSSTRKRAGSSPPAPPTISYGVVRVWRLAHGTPVGEPLRGFDWNSDPAVQAKAWSDLDAALNDL